mmetsp:Transcript_10878/g.27866  ORF Transcript_10878/g.27866 Transcript_10878/m.27866 type:complete len:204 (+) Transcript_10878:276-887(+)
MGVMWQMDAQCVVLAHAHDLKLVLLQRDWCPAPASAGPPPCQAARAAPGAEGGAAEAAARKADQMSLGVAGVAAAAIHAAASAPSRAPRPHVAVVPAAAAPTGRARRRPPPPASGDAPLDGACVAAIAAAAARHAPWFASQAPRAWSGRRTTPLAADGVCVAERGSSVQCVEAANVLSSRLLSSRLLSSRLPFSRVRRRCQNA